MFGNVTRRKKAHCNFFLSLPIFVTYFITCFVLVPTRTLLQTMVPAPQS